MSSKITNLLDSFGLLNQSEIQKVVSNFKVKKLRKNMILLDIGQINNEIYFVEEGILSTFCYQENEQTVMLRFIEMGEFAMSAQSFFLSKESKVVIQALVDTTVLYIHREELEKMCIEIPHANFLVRTFSQISMINYEKLNFLIRQKPSQKRYELFEKMFPSLASQISEKHKASFLNIDPSELSRIRKRIAKGMTLLEKDTLMI
jgi:CRP-like cAMP-binding protein